MNKFELIGIAGTNGSGKDTAGHILAVDYGYLFISVTEILRRECERRGLPVQRENLRKISAEWRRDHGLGVLVDKAVAQYEASKANYKGVAIASLRNHGEADRVHEMGGTVIWLDADIKLRYQRVQKNLLLRDRLSEDTKTFEQFRAEEEAEMKSSGDATTLDMAKVKQKADIIVKNDSVALDEFKKQFIAAMGF